MTCLGRSARFGAPLLVLFCAGLALPAFASSSGRFGYSGKQGSTCAQCHTGGGSAPSITIAGIGAQLQVGSAVDVAITIRTNNGDGGGRAAGFGAALSAAGISISTSDLVVQLQSPGDGDEATHTARQTFAGQNATFAFTLTPTVVGSYTLYVTANDVDSNGGAGAGDDVTAATLPFDVVAAVTDAGSAIDAGSAADSVSGIDAAAPPADAAIEDGAVGVDSAPGIDRGYPDVPRVPPTAGYGGAEDDSGCDCATVPTRSPIALVLLFTLAALRRRARQTEVR